MGMQTSTHHFRSASFHDAGLQALLSDVTCLGDRAIHLISPTVLQEAELKSVSLQSYESVIKSWI